MESAKLGAFSRTLQKGRLIKSRLTIDGTLAMIAGEMNQALANPVNCEVDLKPPVSCEVDCEIKNVTSLCIVEIKLR